MRPNIRNTYARQDQNSSLYNGQYSGSVTTNEITFLQTAVGEYLNSLEPHKRTYESLKNYLEYLYNQIHDGPYHDRDQLEIFTSCLGHFRETLDGKHVHSLKTQIAPIMIELHQAAQNGQTDRFIPGFEKLLAILNRFQDSLLRNLQVPNQMNQSNHLISSSANGIRTESHNHDRDHICRDQIGCDSPQIGFSKPPSSSIMGGLLNDHYLMDQKPNSFRNQQDYESVCYNRLDEIKRKTSKLRNRGSALDENFENFDDLVLSTIQGEVPNSKLKILQIKFTEAIDSYILEMRRLTRSPNYLLPICFRELSAAAFQKLFTDCCSQRRIPSLRNFDSLNFNCVNKDLPHILVYISNIVYPAYDPSNETNCGTLNKLRDAKISAVEQLIKSISPNLSEDTRSELALKILHEICPQRWYPVCEQALTLTFGSAGLTTLKKLEESGGKTTINKLDRQIIVEVPSRWAVKPNTETLSIIQKEINPDAELAIIKTTYQIKFFTSKQNSDELYNDHCGSVKMNISVSNFKQKYPNLFLKSKIKLNEEKQLVASLLSGTFKPRDLKKNVPHIRGISEPAYTQSTWEKTTTWPRAEHIGNPNYPKVQPQIIPQRSDSIERFGSKLRDQFKSPRDFSLRSELLPRKGPFQSHRQPPSISYPIHLDSFSNSSVDISAARSADQRKAGSWPRNPSFGLHLDDLDIRENEPSFKQYAEKVHSHMNQSGAYISQNYQKPPAPGMEDTSLASWNGVAENLPIKHSLSEAIHNSSISKIDVQSQHPTYPLEDIDQTRMGPPIGTTFHRRASSWTAPNK